MAYRKLTNIDEKMIRAAITICRNNGFRAVTAQSVAKMCNVSDFTLFNYFKTKRNFLDEVAKYYDNSLMKIVFDEIQKRKATASMLWDFMLEKTLAEPDGALYYIAYTYEFGYDPIVNNPRASDFLPCAKAIFSTGRFLSDNHYLILWDYLTSMLFYYFEKIYRGYIENTQANKLFIKDIVFKGLDTEVYRSLIE
ncbi:MAG: TetR family transcriptional regulator [Clostridia bacterium]|nr:TetR family transcriptional regulator [Clostridia bacterium]